MPRGRGLGVEPVRPRGHLRTPSEEPRGTKWARKTDDDCNAVLGGICPSHDDDDPATCADGTACRSDDDCRRTPHACPAGHLGDGGPAPTCIAATDDDAAPRVCDRILTLNRGADGRRLYNASAGLACDTDADCARHEFELARDRRCGGDRTRCGYALPCFDPQADFGATGTTLPHYYDYARVGVHESMRTLEAVWAAQAFACGDGAAGDSSCPGGAPCVKGTCAAPVFTGYHDPTTASADPAAHCVDAACTEAHGVRPAPFDVSTAPHAPVQTTPTGEVVVAPGVAMCVCPEGTVPASDLHPLDPNPTTHFRCVPDPCADAQTHGDDGAGRLLVPGVSALASGVAFPRTPLARRELAAPRPVPQCACGPGHVDFSPGSGDRRTVVVDGETRLSDVSVATPTCVADACAPGTAERDRVRIGCDATAQGALGVRSCAGYCDDVSRSCFVATAVGCARRCAVDGDCGGRGGADDCSTDDPAVAALRGNSSGSDMPGVCVARRSCVKGLCGDGKTACASDKDCAVGLPRYLPDEASCGDAAVGGRLLCRAPNDASEAIPVCFQENMGRTLAGVVCDQHLQCDVGVCVGEEGMCSGGCVCPRGQVQVHDDAALGGYRCADVCATYPCLNGGSCAVDADGFPRCSCATGFEGNHCEIRIEE